MLLGSRFTVLDVVRFRMAQECDDQHGDAWAGIVGVRSTIGSTIGTGGEGVNRNSGSKFGNEFAVADSAFLTPVGSEIEVSPVDSDASLWFSTTDFVEQIAGNDVLFAGHVRFLIHFVERFHD